MNIFAVVEPYESPYAYFTTLEKASEFLALQNNKDLYIQEWELDTGNFIPVATY